MLKPLGSGKMKRYPANTRVNPLKNDDPQVAAAISVRMTAYTNEMESQHSIDSLRTVLKDLHTAIEALEAKLASSSGRRTRELRLRLEEARIQETVILAKLTESGVKL